MDRSAGAPLGFALLLLFALAFGVVVAQRGDRSGVVLTSSPSASEVDARASQPTLVWPDGMPGPLNDYVGRTVTASGLSVVSTDADEGFWVTAGDRRAWVQLQTVTESPFTVRPGDVVSFTGRVVPHDPAFPSQVYFCPDRDASATALAQEPTHLAVRLDEFSVGAVG